MINAPDLIPFVLQVRTSVDKALEVNIRTGFVLKSITKVSPMTKVTPLVGWGLVVKTVAKFKQEL